MLSPLETIVQTINILIRSYSYSYCVRYSISKITCFAGNDMPKKLLNTSLPPSYTKRQFWTSGTPSRLEVETRNLEIHQLPKPGGPLLFFLSAFLHYPCNQKVTQSHDFYILANYLSKYTNLFVF